MCAPDGLVLELDLASEKRSGEVRVRMGASCEDTRLEGSFLIEGEPREIDPRHIEPTEVELT